MKISNKSERNEDFMEGKSSKEVAFHRHQPRATMVGHLIDLENTTKKSRMIMLFN